MGKLSVQKALLKANFHAKKGEIIEAERLYQAVLKDFPENRQARQGLTLLQKKYQENSSQPPPREVLHKLVDLYNQGQFGNAADYAETFTQIYPDAFEIWNILGAANKGLGKLSEAAQAFERVTILNPNYSAGYNNLGVTLQSLSEPEQAVVAFKNAIASKPDFAEAHNNLGITLQSLFKLTESVEAYQRAISLRPDFYDAYYNLGIALQSQGEFGEAINAYMKTLSFKPDYPEAYNNIACVLMGQGRFDEAIAAFKEAVSIKPHYAECYYNIGNALSRLGKITEAIAAYKQALEQGKRFAPAEAQMLHQQQYICDFTAWDHLPKIYSWLGTQANPASPWISLGWTDDARKQLAISKAYAKAKFKQTLLSKPERPKLRPKRLKIGYFSADFYNHATMHLMNQIFSGHDKTQVSIFAYSYGPISQDEIHQRLVRDVDAFYDVRQMTDMGIVELARQDNLDIAIDLKGFTLDERLAPFAYGLAPVQISYLGYPGSLGVDFIDYIIADPVVIPEDQRPYYSEKVIYLPHSYQPNDDKRKIAETDTSRADFGLPENAFVLCCFNNSYKISPREFDIWMRLLNCLEGSVLWLLRTNQWVELNLSKEAEQRGINTSRLVFADKLPHSEHLARHKHADLFIDTFNINAHTTASDALWAGLPVVTKQGSQFAARVSASLLRAVGLPELIVNTEAEYEALILELARDGSKLNAIKAKLTKNRLREPLFDTKRYARHFESGLRQAYDRYFDGEEPQDIWIMEDHYLI
jgi:protein O-GlcNAc transferase